MSHVGPTDRLLYVGSDQAGQAQPNKDLFTIRSAHCREGGRRKPAPSPELCRWKPISEVVGSCYTPQQSVSCVTGVLYHKMYSISCKEAACPKEVLQHSSWELSRSPRNQDIFNFSDTHPNAIHSSHTLIQSQTMENLFGSDTRLKAGVTIKDMSCLQGHEATKHRFQRPEREPKQGCSAEHIPTEPGELKEEAEKTRTQKTKAFQRHSREPDLHFGTP